jgi:hypothetical protein
MLITGNGYPLGATENACSLPSVINEEAHVLAREKGVSRPLYALVRLLIAPLLRLWFRMHVSGADQIPREGAAIVAPNHKSFLDSFFIAVCTLASCASWPRPS